LPIPSSVVSTLAGKHLGTVGATLASFIGMSIGAVIGFVVARTWGRPVARWFTKDEDLARMEELSLKLGPTVLVVTRAVPILAEAGVLLMGINRLPWRQFLPPVLLANLGLSLVYAISGKNLPIVYAMAGAVALPVLAACVVRWIWRETPPAPGPRPVDETQSPRTESDLRTRAGAAHVPGEPTAAGEKNFRISSLVRGMTSLGRCLYIGTV
jgi:membrane protein DedA with SNARE-associated domain